MKRGRSPDTLMRGERPQAEANSPERGRLAHYAGTEPLVDERRKRIGIRRHWRSQGNRHGYERAKVADA